VEKLLQEVRSYRDTGYAEEPVETVYFGGGTPSLLAPDVIERIMEALHNSFDLNPREITVEMNPDDVSKEYLQALRELGIDRSSMGVQSFMPELLEFMHRAHDRDEAIRCLELLRTTGFETFTVDLIYGNPGQSIGDLERDLEQLLAFDPPHVSAYSLTVEPRTRLGKQVELGRIRPPDDEAVAEHFDLVVQTLEQAGIQQYEVSNFSRPGHEAEHNRSYWNHTNYLGLGPSAHSFWWEHDTVPNAVRWKNRSDLEAYLQEKPGGYREEWERLGPVELAEERLMMGLRTRDGLTFRELEDRYSYSMNERQRSYLESRAAEGKLELSDDSFRLTRQGLKIADSLILDLVTLYDPDEDGNR